ncbi:DnaJ domain protein [Thiorhodovibrio winogradskyi]|uniref:DnaJ domain protein n=1 Tax=Thiorhodovibrio winogradskyi TaxID=77007 RepID=A0ABZ0S7Q0_9GAMM|nr:J domain-containing protein [Thiorhodovibrio winogradskyi]
MIRDPYLMLGLGPDADDAAVERAYHDAIRRCPPERDAQRFSAIREAFEALRTERDRLAYELFDRTPVVPADILDRAAPIGAPRRPDAASLQALLRPNA